MTFLPGPLRVRWGHAMERTFYLALHVYLVYSFAHALLAPGQHPPLPVLVIAVSFMAPSLLLSLLWHHDCMPCLTPPPDPEQAARRNKAWLSLFHLSTPVTLFLFLVPPLVGFVLNLFDYLVALSTFGVAAAAILTSTARRRHDRLELWCHLCYPDHGGGGEGGEEDDPITPTPERPTALR